MDESERIELLSKAIWGFYYPLGGSLYNSYEQLQEKDKEMHRAEAREVAEFLSGKKIMVNS